VENRDLYARETRGAHRKLGRKSKVEIPVRTCDVQQIGGNERMARNICLRLVYGGGISVLFVLSERTGCWRGSKNRTKSWEGTRGTFIFTL
jgi:ABC-type microcin C transport system permease subunit YejE